MYQEEEVNSTLILVHARRGKRRKTQDEVEENKKKYLIWLSKKFPTDEFRVELGVCCLASSHCFALPSLIHIIATSTAATLCRLMSPRIVSYIYTFFTYETLMILPSSFLISCADIIIWWSVRELSSTLLGILSSELSWAHAERLSGSPESPEDVAVSYHDRTPKAIWALTYVCTYQKSFLHLTFKWFVLFLLIYASIMSLNLQS